MSGRGKKRKVQACFYKEWWFWRRIGLVIGGVVTFVLLFSQTPFFQPVWKRIFGPSVEVEAERKAIVVEVVEGVSEAKRTQDTADLPYDLLCGEQAAEGAEGEVEKGEEPLRILEFKHGLTGFGPDMTAIGVSEGMTYTYKIDFRGNCIEEWNPTDVPRF